MTYLSLKWIKPSRTKRLPALNILMKVRLIVVSLVLLFLTTVVGNSTDQDFRENFLGSMNKCYLEYYKKNPGSIIVPSRFVIAIAIHESNWGRSRIAQVSNNLYGMKTTSNDPAHFVYALAGSHIKLAKYDNRCDSVRDFINLMTRDKRYSNVSKYFAKARVLNYKYVLDLMPVYYEDPTWPAKVLNIINGLK
jgi:flagellum-specific peptidoglycan hydrolase FlgJ